MVWKRRIRNRRRGIELNPDEILLDARNLPQFDGQQFEGRIEQPISKRTFQGIGIFLLFVGICFVGRLGVLQIAKGAFYEKKSEQNSLDHVPLFADRGVIYDRNGVELAWNSSRGEGEPLVRSYTGTPGFSGLLGYVSYPAKDAKGVFWQFATIGKDGIEKDFDTALAGSNGTRLVETDVSGNILSENMIDSPIQGSNIELSIDAGMQEALYRNIVSLAEQSGYIGGAGAVMDISTGELLAITTYPEYNQTILSEGEEKETIQSYLTSSARPFLFRMTEGLYTPGSIVKPFLALGALQEGVITPQTVIFSSGELRFPNPYAPGTYTIFRDNAAHGAVDLAHALAVSSNIYFYEIGGGFGAQQGLGIERINKYLSLFGIGQDTGINISGELEGTIPSVEWKATRFPGDPWRIGDTYNTSIGQYGFQVTPIQMLRAVASIAARGTLVQPTILKTPTGEGAISSDKLPIDDAYYSAVQNGMRLAVTDGTARALQNSSIPVAAKTGTAQIKGNTRVNSWAIGFFPSNAPKYAFVVLMEDGPKVSSGAANAFKGVLTYLAEKEVAASVDE